MIFRGAGFNVFGRTRSGLTVRYKDKAPSKESELFAFISDAF